MTGKKANFLGYAEDGHEKVGMLYFSNGEVQVRRLVSFHFANPDNNTNKPDKVTVNLLKNPDANPNYGKTKRMNPKRVPCTALDSSEDYTDSSSNGDPDSEGEDDPDSLGIRPSKK